MNTTYTIEVFQSIPSDRKWFFHCRSSNGGVVFFSKGYKKMASAMNAVESIFENFRSPSNFGNVRVLLPKEVQTFIYKHNDGRSPKGKVYTRHYRTVGRLERIS